MSAKAGTSDEPRIDIGQPSSAAPCASESKIINSDNKLDTSALSMEEPSIEDPFRTFPMYEASVDEDYTSTEDSGTDDESDTDLSSILEEPGTGERNVDKPGSHESSLEKFAIDSGTDDESDTDLSSIQEVPGSGERSIEKPGSHEPSLEEFAINGPFRWYPMYECSTTVSTSEPAVIDAELEAFPSFVDVSLTDIYESYFDASKSSQEPSNDSSESVLRAELERLGSRPSHPPGTDIWEARVDPQYKDVAQYWCDECQIDGPGFSAKVIEAQLEHYQDWFQYQLDQRAPGKWGWYLHNLTEILELNQVPMVRTIIINREEQRAVESWVEYCGCLLLLKENREFALDGYMSDFRAAWQALVDAGIAKDGEEPKDVVHRILTPEAQDLWSQFRQCATEVREQKASIRRAQILLDWALSQVDEIDNSSDDEGLPLLPHEMEQVEDPIPVPAITITSESPSPELEPTPLPPQDCSLLEIPPDAHTVSQRERTRRATLRAAADLVNRRRSESQARYPTLWLNMLAPGSRYSVQDLSDMSRG